VVKIFNDRGVYRCKAEVSSRARPGVVNGMGIWWRKFGMDGTNVNQLTSQKLTDLGRGPVFYDCAVEVQLDAAPAASQLQVPAVQSVVVQGAAPVVLPDKALAT
jgi:hypothetical protein